MKKIFTLILLAALSSSIFAQTEKTLLKSFNLHGEQVISIALNGSVDIKEWDNDIMRVHVNIALENASNSMLKYLVSAGRYNLKLQKNTEGVMTLNSPKTNIVVKTKNGSLQESLQYTIFIPKNIQTEIINKSGTSYLLMKKQNNS